MSWWRFTETIFPIIFSKLEKWSVCGSSLLCWFISPFLQGSNKCACCMTQIMSKNTTHEQSADGQIIVLQCLALIHIVMCILYHLISLHSYYIRCATACMPCNVWKIRLKLLLLMLWCKYCTMMAFTCHCHSISEEEAVRHRATLNKHHFNLTKRLTRSSGTHSIHACVIHVKVEVCF